MKKNIPTTPIVGFSSLVTQGAKSRFSAGLFFLLMLFGSVSLTAQTGIEYATSPSNVPLESNFVNKEIDDTGIYYVGQADPGLVTTPGAHQATISTNDGGAIVKLDHDGNVLWSTYLTGDRSEPLESVLVGQSLYVSFFVDEAQAGYNIYNPDPLNNDPQIGIAKFDALTGAFQWGTMLGGDRYQDFSLAAGNGFVALGIDEARSNFPVTADALESTPTGPGAEATSTATAYFAVFNDTDGTIDYATYYRNGASKHQSGLSLTSVAIAGNILAFGGGSYPRNVTSNAYASAPHTSTFDHSYLTYFDLNTKQITYDTYLNNSLAEEYGDRIIQMETDGSRFYLTVNNFRGSPFRINDPLGALQFGNNQYVVQVWEPDGSLSASFPLGINLRNNVNLKIDAANNRWFVYGGTDRNSATFPNINGLIPTSPSSSKQAFVLEFEIGTNNLFFSQGFEDGLEDSRVSDVKIDANGNLFLLGVGMTNTTLLDKALITPDAFRSSPADGNSSFILKLDANRNLLYGSHFVDLTTTNSEFFSSIYPLDNGTFEIAGSTNSANIPYTVDAQYIDTEAGRKSFYLRATCCPPVTNNTIDATQMVCINGLAAPITGSDAMLDPIANPDLNIGGTITPQNTETMNYQWQASPNGTLWENIPGAVERDFLPAPTAVNTFFRRLASAGLLCDNPSISNEHEVVVNGIQAPVLIDGTTDICPTTDVVIGSLATMGTGAYTYAWGPTAEIDNPLIAQPTFNGTEGAVYTVTVTDMGNGCQFAENWQVNVVSADAGELTEAYCANTGSSVLLGTPAPPTGGFTYLWTTDGLGDPITSLDNPNVAQPTASPAGETTYELSLTIDAVGCTTMDQITVNVSNPVADAGPDLVRCLGEGAVLGTPVQPGLTYGWAPGLYIDNQNVAQPNFLSAICPTRDGFDATGNPLVYSLTVIDDATGCTDVDFVEVAILQVDLVNNYSCPPARIGDRENECGLDLPGVTFTWSVVAGDATSLLAAEVNNPFPTVNPSVTTTYDLQVCLDGYCCGDQVTVSPDCGTDCAVIVSAVSQIGCPVGGSFGTTLTASGAADGFDVNNLPPGWTIGWSPAANLSNPTALTTTVNTLLANETFTFNVFDQNGNVVCSDSELVYASVAASPIITLPSETTVCTSEPTNIGIPSITGWSYAWSPTDNLTGFDTSDPVATLTETTTYTVTATDMVTGCFYTQRVMVNVNVPTVNAGADRDFCENAIVRLGSPARPNYAYSWTPALGLSQPNVAQPIDTIFTTVTYFLEVTNTITGCTATDDVTFTLSSPPVYDAPDVDVCEGATVQIGLPEEPGFSYFWSPTTGLSNANVAQPLASVTSDVTYTVIVSAGTPGCYTSDQVNVTVLATANSLTLTDVEDCEGATVNIGVADEGGTYSWSPITGLSDAGISNPTVTVGASAATYTLTWTAPDGCTFMDDVTVMPFDEEALNFSMAINLCEGDDVTIGPAAAVAGATYLWSSVSGDGTGTLTSTSIHNPVATPTQTTTYRLTYTSPNSCVTTKDVVITVNPIPTVELGPDQVICAPTVLMPDYSPASAGGTNYNESFESGDGGWTQNSGDDFNWSRDAFGTPDFGTGPSSGADGSTWYFYLESTGRSSNDNAIMTSPPILLDAATTSMSFQYHMYGFGIGTLILEISDDAGATWDPLWTLSGNRGNQWSRALVDISAYAGSTVQIRFNGTVRRAFRGDMAIDDIRFPGNNLPSIVWSTGATTSTLAILPTPQPTTYSITVTGENGCTATDEILISPPFNVDAGEDRFICAEETTTIGTPDASGGGLMYNWSISSGPGPLPAVTNMDQIDVTPTATTTYLLTVDDGLGCSITDEVTITLRAPGDLGPDQIVCTGGCITIGVPYQEGFTYTWAPTTDITTDFVNQPEVMICPTGDITYQLFMNDIVNGCVFSDDISIAVGPNPAPAVDAGSDLSICSGETPQLGAAGTPGLVYSWSPATGLSNANTAQPLFLETDPGTYNYTLTVLDQATNCRSEDMVEILVNELPDIRVYDEPDLLCLGASGPFGAFVEDFSEPQGQLSYSWSPAALFSDPTATITTISVFDEDVAVTLVATNELTGCASSYNTVVMVSPTEVIADAGPDQSVCVDEQVTIGGPNTSTAAGTTYEWSYLFFGGNPQEPFNFSNGSYTDGIRTNATASPSTDSDRDDGTYRLTVTGADGCTIYDDMELRVDPEAIINAGEDMVLCSATEYTLTATSNAGNDIYGTWTQESGPTTATFSSLTLANATVSGLTNGTYQFRWTVDEGVCNPGSDVVEIQVVDAPVLVVASPVCYTEGGSGADLTAAEVTAGSTLNGAELSYWLDAAATIGPLVSGPTNVTEGTYYIRAFNTMTSCEVIMPVMVVAPPVVTLASPATICSTQAIDLTQDASITPAALGGEWTSSGNGTFTTGAVFGTATTYFAGSEDLSAGQVTLTLTTNDSGEPCGRISSSVTFTVLPVDCGTYPWDGSRD